jgi:hypothetical protein
MATGVNRIITLGSKLVDATGGYGLRPRCSSAAYQEEAQELFDSLSPAERIGQLFMVTFRGDTAPPESEIARLIADYHVGGVVLLAKNNNITGYGDVAMPCPLRLLISITACNNWL